MIRHFGLSKTLGVLMLPWAFITVGCSMSMSIHPPAIQDQDEAATPPPPKYLPDSLIDSDNHHTQTVNAFGEFTKTGVQAASLNPAMQQHTFVTAGFDADVSVDPETKWIAFAGARADAHTHLFRQGLDAQLVVQLTDGESDEAQPCISRDGKRIAFSSNRSGHWHVYVMAADGRDITQITDGNGDEMHPSFSPDGRRLVCCRQSEETASDWKIVIVDIATGQQQEIGSGLFPSWSPRRDGDVIAFQKTRSRGSRWFSIWTCQLSTAEDGSVSATGLTEVAASANAALVGPCWSPDGQSLTCCSISTGNTSGKQDVWIMSCDGHDRHRLTDGGNHNASPFWATDGNVYFVSDRTGHECIWSLPTEDANAAKMDKTAANEPAEVEP